MAMFLNGLPVTECVKVFENLSHKAFDRGFVSSNSIFSRLRELLISYFADSLYSAHNLGRRASHSVWRGHIADGPLCCNIQRC